MFSVWQKTVSHHAYVTANNGNWHNFLRSFISCFRLVTNSNNYVLKQKVYSFIIHYFHSNQKKKKVLILDAICHASQSDENVMLCEMTVITR